MKKANHPPLDPDDDDMLPEYDFSDKKGVRGKYYLGRQQGYTVRIHHEDGTVTVTDYPPVKKAVELDPDVSAFFPDSESVNKALRMVISLVSLVPARQVGEQKAKYTVRKQTAKSPAARK